jgi:hypothetical protein
MKKQILIGLTLSLALFGSIAKPAFADNSHGKSMPKQTNSGFGSVIDKANKVYDAFETGLSVGNLIERKTGAGSASGQWLYDHSDPKTARQAADSFYEAEQSWGNGNYGDSLKHGARGVQQMYDAWQVRPLFDKLIDPLVVK